MDLGGNVQIKCPGCATPFEINLKDAGDGSTHTCVSCGATITFKGDGGPKAAAGLQQVQDAWDALKRSGRR